MPNFTAYGKFLYYCSALQYYMHFPVSLLDMVFLTIFVLWIPLASGKAYGTCPTIFLHAREKYLIEIQKN